MPETIEPPVAAETAPDMEAGVSSMASKFAKLMADNNLSADSKPGIEQKLEPQKVDAKVAAPLSEKKEPAADDGFLKQEPPANMSPKASESWKNFKTQANTEIKARETKIAELTRELETVKKASGQAASIDPVEVESLRKQNKELDDQLKLLAIERHPQFKAHYDAKMDAAVAKAQEAVGPDKAGKVKRILAITDANDRFEAIDELYAELSESRKAALARAVDNYTEVQRERTVELSKAGENYQKMQELEKKQGEQTTAKQREGVEKVTKRALELANNLECFKIKEGDDAHNKEVASRQQFVKDLFNGKIDGDVLAFTPLLASEALYFREKVIPGYLEKIKSLEATIASYTAASPKATGGVRGNGQSATGPKSFMDVWNEKYKPNH